MTTVHKVKANYPYSYRIEQVKIWLRYWLDGFI